MSVTPTDDELIVALDFEGQAVRLIGLTSSSPAITDDSINPRRGQRRKVPSRRYSSCFIQYSSI